MDERLNGWQHGVERLLAEADPDYGEALSIAEEIARCDEQPTLRQAATQGLPSFRNAALKGADSATKAAARRRLGVVRDVLHSLTFPRFGKRGDAPKVLTPEARHRQMLGLPPDRHLSAPEIHQAFKHAAKTVHPDAGGSAAQFLEISAARDALIRHCVGRVSGA
jgi:hypothetical protein